jgi:hypothetical protein
LDGDNVKNYGENITTTMALDGETYPGEQTTTNDTIQEETADVDVNYIHPSNNSNECEHVQHNLHRRINKDDIGTWIRSSAQLYLRSNNNSHREGTIYEWEAIALCTHLTDRVSKYVKNAVSSYAVKDWQWLARLMERLTHRGLLLYGIIAVVIM